MFDVSWTFFCLSKIIIPALICYWCVGDTAAEAAWQQFGGEGAGEGEGAQSVFRALCQLHGREDGAASFTCCAVPGQTSPGASIGRCDSSSRGHYLWGCSWTSTPGDSASLLPVGNTNPWLLCPFPRFSTPMGWAGYPQKGLLRGGATEPVGITPGRLPWRGWGGRCCSPSLPQVSNLILNKETQRWLFLI